MIADIGTIDLTILSDEAFTAIASIVVDGIDTNAIVETRVVTAVVVSVLTFATIKVGQTVTQRFIS